jgi:hypothetical protein
VLPAHPHPDESAIRAYVLNQQPESVIRKIDAHVFHCSECMQLLVRLVRGTLNAERRIMNT